MEIKYERMTENDYPAIKKLITEAWFGDYEFKKKYIKQYANCYLYMYLSESDFQTVAKDGDKVVGFIFGKYRKLPFKTRAKYSWKLLGLGIKMLFSYPGRRGIKMTLITDKVNKKLLKPFKKELKAELVLFIVDEDYRKLGIGSTLQDGFCDYLRRHNVKNVYLYTDTYSNFEYYEHRGYERKGALPVDFKIKGEEMDPLPEYFIYVKEL